MEYYSVSKKKKQNNAICSNMDGRRVVILSEVRQRKTNIMQHHFICGIKKNGASELIYITEIESQV